MAQRIEAPDTFGADDAIQPDGAVGRYGAVEAVDTGQTELAVHLDTPQQTDGAERTSDSGSRYYGERWRGG